MRNLELKVQCDQRIFAEISERAAALGTRQSLWQRDTYFVVPNGRLKLREIRGENATPAAELIGYARPDTEGSRWSTYYRADIAQPEINALRDALGSTLGERIVVEKHRDVVLSGQTRIHLDNVVELGYFVELETVVDNEDSDAGATVEHGEIIAALGIGDLPPIGGSYSDLLEAAAEK